MKPTFNKQLLLEDITFPLRIDDWCVFIWDSNRNMVAMFDDSREISTDASKLIIEALNSYINEPDRPLKESPKVILKNGNFYDVNNRLFLITRGWGRLQQKPNPEARQDNISNYILNAINSYMVQ